ncbi:MAG: hypothetical protein K1X88_24725 [Nannocystaceae bacterium]|nr:hypothetical protein [Nannocystaceae bacterium]
MTRKSEDDEAPLAADPDRAAILARRQRFIAFALSGLASAAACKRNAQPQVCLSMPQPLEGGGGEAPPQACLEVAAPDPDVGGDEGRPQPCLDITVRDDGGAAPQPCLEVAPPEPTEPTPPRPCLKVRPPEDPPPEPPPQVCLRVAKPR